MLEKSHQMLKFVAWFISFAHKLSWVQNHLTLSRSFLLQNKCAPDYMWIIFNVLISQ